jgi:hypothetical protein
MPSWLAICTAGSVPGVRSHMRPAAARAAAGSSPGGRRACGGVLRHRVAVGPVGHGAQNSRSIVAASWPGRSSLTGPGATGRVPARVSAENASGWSSAATWATIPPAPMPARCAGRHRARGREPQRRLQDHAACTRLLQIDGDRRTTIAQVIARDVTPAARERLAQRVGPREHGRATRAQNQRRRRVAEVRDAKPDAVRLHCRRHTSPAAMTKPEVRNEHGSAGPQHPVKLAGRGREIGHVVDDGGEPCAVDGLGGERQRGGMPGEHARPPGAGTHGGKGLDRHDVDPVPAGQGGGPETGARAEVEDARSPAFSPPSAPPACPPPRPSGPSSDAHTTRSPPMVRDRHTPTSSTCSSPTSKAKYLCPSSSTSARHRRRGPTLPQRPRAPGPALPELVERLARQRLHDQAGTSAEEATPDASPFAMGSNVTYPSSRPSRRNGVNRDTPGGSRTSDPRA